MAIITDTPVESLTPKEVEVLTLLAREGLSNKELAERLVVVEWTIWKHLSNIYGKLGVKNRTEATLWALRNLTIEPADS